MNDAMGFAPARRIPTIKKSDEKGITVAARNVPINKPIRPQS
jgi:hypothetical protein